MQFTLELKQLNSFFPPLFVPTICRLLILHELRFHEEMLLLFWDYNIEERIFILDISCVEREWNSLPSIVEKNYRQFSPLIIAFHFLLPSLVISSSFSNVSNDREKYGFCRNFLFAKKKKREELTVVWREWTEIPRNHTEDARILRI